MTQMLEPRDQMELIWTKQATDAIWESQREGRERRACPRRCTSSVFKLRRSIGAKEAQLRPPSPNPNRTRSQPGDERRIQVLSRPRCHAAAQVQDP